MTLRAVTLLAENTVGILDDVCAQLTVTLGRKVVRDPDGVAADRVDVPVGEPGDMTVDADLVWGCGYLLRKRIDAGQLDAEIVAAPVFAGQVEAVYHSVIIAAEGGVASLADARGSRLAINERVSWSGHHALVRHLGGASMVLSLFGPVVETGSHAASVEAVAGGAADVAAIDHSVWDWLVATGRTAGVRAVDRTQNWPAPPFAVTRRRPEPVRRALVEALLALPPVDGLAAIAPATPRTYDPLLA